MLLLTCQYFTSQSSNGAGTMGTNPNTGGGHGFSGMNPNSGGGMPGGSQAQLS